MQKLTNLIDRIASVRVLAALVLLALLFPVLLFPAAGIGEAKPLDLYWSYSPEQAYAYLGALGGAGRAAYIRMELTLDMAFPVIYSLALSIALALVMCRFVAPSSRLYALCLFPLLIVMMDWCENLGLVAAAYAFPHRMEGVIIVASGFTSLKWFFLMSSALLLVAAVLAAARRQR